jgi:hypothetical protein
MPRKTDRRDAPKRARATKPRAPRQGGTAEPRPGSSQVEQVDDQTGRSDREAGVGRPLQLDREPAPPPRSA